MKKILVIEDNREIRENIAEILELANYQVISASNGREGVSHALAERPDLILCDIMMPELDGYGVLHMVQQHPDLQRIPFIFLTAKSEKEEMRKGMALGADDYIPKPFDPTDLLNTIQVRMRKAELFANPFPKGLSGIDEIISRLGGEKALHAFVEGRHIDKYKKKERIYSEGNHPIRLYYVEKGKVRIFKRNEDGKDLIIKIVNEGEFFGYNAMFEEAVYKENADALENCEIAAIPKSEFDELMNSNPDARRSFIRVLASDISEREEQLVHLAYNSLRRKVADALLNVYGKFGEQEGFTISLTRENLAAVAGTATESLIRTLTDFRSEKIIDINEGKIAILDREKLRRMVN